MCVCVAPGAHRGQKRESNPLELELQTVVNQNEVFCKSSSAVSH